MITLSFADLHYSEYHLKTPAEVLVCGLVSVGTGRARLLGFRVGFGGQNPSLGTLRLLGFGPFRALGFSGFFQAFLVHVQLQLGLFISSCVS